MAAQGLSCARIIALSLSLVLGKVSKLSTCMSLKYGEDPALSEPAKQARKAGKKTIATVIKSKDYSGAGAFFSALMQSYAADGMIEESSLVAAWWAETSGCFSSAADKLKSIVFTSSFSFNLLAHAVICGLSLGVGTGSVA